MVKRPGWREGIIYSSPVSHHLSKQSYSNLSSHEWGASLLPRRQCILSITGTILSKLGRLPGSLFHRMLMKRLIEDGTVSGISGRLFSKATCSKVQSKAWKECRHGSTFAHETCRKSAHLLATVRMRTKCSEGTRKFTNVRHWHFNDFQTQKLAQKHKAYDLRYDYGAAFPIFFYGRRVCFTTF